MLSRCENYYPATMHNFTQALGDISFPITKKELIAKYGDKEIVCGVNGKKVALKEWFAPMPVEEYHCAAELYNNVTCVIW